MVKVAKRSLNCLALQGSRPSRGTAVSSLILDRGSSFWFGSARLPGVGDRGGFDSWKEHSSQQPYLRPPGLEFGAVPFGVFAAESAISVALSALVLERDLPLLEHDPALEVREELSLLGQGAVLKQVLCVPSLARHGRRPSRGTE